MTDYSVHTTQLYALNKELGDALRSERWDEVLSITNMMQFHLREIDNYARKRMPSVHY